MDDKIEVPYLRRYPLSIEDWQYSKILDKIYKGKSLDEDDLALIPDIIANAMFWKDKYADLNRKIWALAEDNHERF